MVFSTALSLGFVIGSRILFVGNSHTQNGDVPGTVQKLLASEKAFAGVTCSYFGVGLLNQWAGNPGLVRAVKDGGFDFAVLQGAAVSSSHRFTYSQASGIELAKLLVNGGSKVYLVSEWPRRDWDETEYTESIYRAMAKESGAEVIPVGRVWDGVRKRLNGIDLWQADGNHANSMGSYLSSRVISRWLGGEKLNYVPAGISPEFVDAIDAAYFDLN
ncbi:MAG: hypothetical protein ACKVQS_06295 [Fimbriimonadaceae bacterium]